MRMSRFFAVFPSLQGAVVREGAKGHFFIDRTGCDRYTPHVLILDSSGFAPEVPLIIIAEGIGYCSGRRDA